MTMMIEHDSSHGTDDEDGFDDDAEAVPSKLC